MGAFLVAVTATGVYEGLRNYWPHPLLIAGVALLLVFVLVLSVDFSSLFSRGGNIQAHQRAGEVQKRPGLVALASAGPGISSVRNAIDHHKGVLQQVWLIATPGKSEENALAVKREYADSPPIAIRTLASAQDAYDPLKTYAMAKQIVSEAKQQFGMEEADLIADYTGGTATMSVGLALASQYPIGLEVLYPNELDDKGFARFDKGSKPLEVHIQVT